MGKKVLDGTLWLWQLEKLMSTIDSYVDTIVLKITITICFCLKVYFKGIPTRYYWF